MFAVGVCGGEGTGVFAVGVWCGSCCVCSWCVVKVLLCLQ